ncbi:hypothetical protein H072_6004 [Dactylellina haptotyla CBS 200.50]|uniref:Uncharacterized protein n=1 Tax=Dactylellina haptotyla (strain CBS 200.50) TaxID=1284197 RepID=S8AB67_DACHA|nr:hypothetical protein H072_6004 [Dactylellina haptotyla CBS 200.50]
MPPSEFGYTVGIGADAAAMFIHKPKPKPKSFRVYVLVVEEGKDPGKEMENLTSSDPDQIFWSASRLEKPFSRSRFSENEVCAVKNATKAFVDDAMHRITRYAEPVWDPKENMKEEGGYVHGPEAERLIRAAMGEKPQESDAKDTVDDATRQRRASDAAERTVEPPTEAGEKNKRKRNDEADAVQNTEEENSKRRRIEATVPTETPAALQASELDIAAKRVRARAKRTQDFKKRFKQALQGRDHTKVLPPVAAPVSKRHTRSSSLQDLKDNTQGTESKWGRAYGLFPGGSGDEQEE